MTDTKADMKTDTKGDTKINTELVVFYAKGFEIVYFDCDPNDYVSFSKTNGVAIAESVRIAFENGYGLIGMSEFEIIDVDKFLDEFQNGEVGISEMIRNLKPVDMLSDEEE